MWLTIIAGLIGLYLCSRWWFKRGIKLTDVPGPTSSPWWQIFSLPDPTKTHLLLQDLVKQYGRIMKIPYITGDDILILTDYDAIHQVTITDGKKFGGRPITFRVDVITKSTGIMQNNKPDATWKTLRKVTQRHLRQFGDGLSRLETIIVDIAEDMFSDFESQVGKPYDPHNVIFNTGLNSIAFLIIGRRTRTGDEVVEKMREYESLFFRTMSVDMSCMILDAFPWLRHFGWPAWKLFKRTLQLEAEIWKEANDYADQNPDVESICKVLRDHIADGDPNLTETDAIKATLSLLLAGVTTTGNSFYATVNILAHNKEVQDKLFHEILIAQEQTGRHVTLQDRPDMPYARAVLLEILRYTSVAGGGVSHLSMEDGEIQGHKIPAGTFITMPLYVLHYDEDFWQDPYNFDPERFLDEDRDLVPADHPNRKHLMPFGAGTRVCLGESLAMTRLFLWLVTFVRRFEVSPAEGNEKISTDTRHFKFDGVLRPKEYEVILKKRN